MTDPAAAWFDRVRQHLDATGRPPLGSMADWEVFPFERAGLTAKPLGERVVPEPSSRKDPAACRSCRALARDAHVLHVGRTLAVIREVATSLPFAASVVAREHRVLDDLEDEDHAELGRLLARTYVAVQQLDGVGNVHITKWENGSGHLSINVMARPVGVLELRGSNLPVWADMLPDIPEDEYAARANVVRAALA